MMHPFIQKVAAAFSVVVLASALVSCGSGSGGSADISQAQGKGTVGILLTDKPADPALFAAIIASIVKVELMGSDENGRVTLYSGPAKEFDLLRLRNESIPLVFKDNVPAGTYCKIRLILSDLELVLADSTPETLIDNDSEHPKLPGNGKLDLVVRDCFNVMDDEVLTLQLDMDAGKSIHVIEKGNCSSKPDKSCFNFRPVVFVDVLDKDFDSKLVRLNGVIEEVDSVEEYLLLCKAIPSNDMDNEGCVKVDFGPDSAFFDNVTHGGEPRAISELLSEVEPTNVGKELTVVGWAKSWASKDNDNDKPEAYYPLMHLEALVAELGDFLQIEGTVAAVDEDLKGFEMNVSSGGPVITDSTLAVVYQPGDTDINGTRIVSKSGVLLNPQDVDKDQSVQVDGTLQLLQDSDPMLKAALVILDKGTPGVEQVTGVIQLIGTDTLELTPDADMVCGATISTLTVDLAANLEILTVTIYEDRSEIEPGGTLMVGQTVGMNGTCELTGGYQTDNVVIVDDLR